MNLQPRSAGFRARRLGALPMTSMIDVVFLLLIFFLVTSSFAPEESRLDAALQTEGPALSSVDLQPQVVLVEMGASGPVYRIGGRLAVTPEELTSILKQLPKEAGVAVRVRPDVPVAAAAAALQAAHDAGFTKRSYVPTQG